MEEKKIGALKLSQVEVIREVDLVVKGLAPESPGEGTNIVVVTWASNGESFAVQDPGPEAVKVFGVFSGVNKHEFLIERGSDRYGVSEGALQGTHLSEEAVPICPAGVEGALNSKGKRVWSQTTDNRGVINLGVVVLYVDYSNGAANEAELLDNLHDWGVDAHEEVKAEYDALGSELDRLAYKTSGHAVDTWIATFKTRVELEYLAADRGRWGLIELEFVSCVKSVADYRVVLAIGNDVKAMLGLTYESGSEGYYDYSSTFVPLTEGDSAIGTEFFLESENGKIGLRVFGCDHHTSECGTRFTYYDVDLTRVKIEEPCPFAEVAEASPADRRMLRQVREFRDRYLEVFPRGRMYIDLYRAHTFEMWRLVAADPEIRKQAKALLPHVVRLVKTWRESEPARLNQATIEGIHKLADLAKRRASAQLQNSMNKVLPDLEKFKDLSLGEILLVLQEFDFPKE